MATFSRKLGYGRIFELVSVVLDVAGLVILIMCNSKGADYEFSYAVLLDLGVIEGFMLVVVATLSPRFGFDKKGYLGLFASSALSSCMPTRPFRQSARESS